MKCGRARRRFRLTGIVVGGALASSCGGDSPSMLSPAGPGAARIETMWWVMLWISVAVFVVVAVMLVMAIRASRTGDDDLDRSHVGWGEPFVAIAGVFVPALILAGVFLFSLKEMNVLARGGDDAALTIDVEGHNWWWEARYPNGAVTANEIHIPAGEPVRVRLLTADVIHSFWVPRLQAKTDMVPGETNEMWLEADRPGTYRGQCAEFCSLQHANMIFFVVADAPAEFATWMSEQALDAAPPAAGGAAAGEKIFLSSTCAGCHAVRGTTATAQAGPDLTHLAARRTIGSGVLPNTREALARFITDPQSVKPGVSMPPTELSGDDLAALLDYLENLR